MTSAANGMLRERYASLFLIGQGGMGTIEAALDRTVKGASRVVALKRLPPERARSAQGREMFLREARLAALLAHPNVVRAYAFGELGGEHFLAMEYVEGEPLTRVVEALRARARCLAPELAAYLIAEVCDGLHAAHELCDVSGAPLNVIHRDVSPQNVMVGYDGQVKLLDFGVAKIDAVARTTKTGEVKGKVAYMSPEQAMGDPIDRRSDLYAIGALFFECLTGDIMWGDGTDMDVLRRLALEAPPSLAHAAPGLAASLHALHARLVARAPEGRPGTAREVAEALRAYVAASTSKADHTALKAQMGELFAAEAAERRRVLGEALRAVGASEAEMGMAEDPTAHRAAVRVTRTRTTTRVQVAAGLAVVAVAAVGGALALRSMGTPTAPRVESVASAARALPVPVVDAPSSGRPAPAPALSTAVPSPSSAPASTVASPVATGRAVPRPPRVRGASPASSATTRPIDVDPTPF